MAELPVIHGEIRLGEKEPLIVINEQSFHLEIQVLDGTTQKFLEAWIDSKKITKKEQTPPGNLTLIHPEAMTDLLLSEPSETLLIPAEAHKELLDTFIEKQKKKEKVPAATNKKAPVKITEKRCSKCGKIKPLSDFNKSTADKTGRQSMCREDMRLYWKHKSRDYQEQKLRDIKSKKQPASKPEKFSSYAPQSFPTATEIIEKEIKEDKPPAELPIKPPKETAEKIKKEQEAETKRFHQKCTKKIDDIIKKSFDEHGVSGIYAQKLLPGFSMTEIYRRCQDLGLLDQYGLRPVHKGKQADREPENLNNE